MNQTQMIVVNHESKYWIEVLDASKLFDLRKAKSDSSKSYFECKKENRRGNRLKRLSRLYSSIDHSYIIHHGNQNSTFMITGSSRKREAPGKFPNIKKVLSSIAVGLFNTYSEL